MDITELLRSATDDLEPDVGRLVTGALARGRRRQQLARTAAAGTGVAVCAVAAGLALTIVSAGSGRSGPHAEAPAGAGRVSAGSGLHTAQATARVPVTPQVVLQTALALLPVHGPTTHYSGSRSAGYAAAEFVYDDGHGAAQVSVSVASGPAGGLGAACQISACSTRPHGAHLAIYQGHSRPGDASTAVQWGATLAYPDGLTVEVTEWNAPLEKDAATTRPAPPFSIAVLTAVVSSGRWTATVPAARVASAAHLFATTS